MFRNINSGSCQNISIFSNGTWLLCRPEFPLICLSLSSVRLSTVEITYQDKRRAANQGTMIIVSRLIENYGTRGVLHVEMSPNQTLVDGDQQACGLHVVHNLRIFYTYAPQG